MVVEAAVKGGALITAATALEQGRMVFAVPGDVDRDSSAGCNLLIRDGAHPVLGPADLIEELSLLSQLPAPINPASPDGSGDELLSALGPVGRTLEWIADHLSLTPQQTMSRVTQLEVAGVITRNGVLFTTGTSTDAR